MAVFYMEALNNYAGLLCHPENPDMDVEESTRLYQLALRAADAPERHCALYRYDPALAHAMPIEEVPIDYDAKILRSNKRRSESITSETILTSVVEQTFAKESKQSKTIKTTKSPKSATPAPRRKK